MLSFTRNLTMQAINIIVVSPAEEKTSRVLFISPKINPIEPLSWENAMNSDMFGNPNRLNSFSIFEEKK